MLKLFVYGSLLEDDIRKRVIGRDISLIWTYIYNYALKPLSFNSNYPTLVVNYDRIVHGAVIILSGDELKKVDKYETSMYRRKFFYVEDFFTFVENDT